MYIYFPDRLDTAISRWCIRQWGRRLGFDAVMICMAAWTPIVLMSLIVLASTGLLLNIPMGAHLGLVHGAAAVIAALLGRALNEPISKAVKRSRPFEQLALAPLTGHERGESFPSNHTTGAFALAVSMLGVPGYGPVMLALAAMLALSRIYTGLHYLTDIVAGALHGSALAVGVVLMTSAIG